MVQKIPPPPRFSGAEWQAFNRWLIELQAILSNTGGIDPAQVEGLLAVYTQVGVLTGEVTTLQGQVTTLQGQVTTLQGQVTTLQGEVAALQARAQILNGAGAPAAGLGNVGDLYLNLAAVAAPRLYGKLTLAGWTAIA